MSEQVYLSSSPHIHSGETTEKVMRAVIYSLLPACAVAVYFLNGFQEPGWGLERVVWAFDGLVEHIFQ